MPASNWPICLRAPASTVSPPKAKDFNWIGPHCGPVPGHGSVTADETIETKHNIRRKNSPPIKLTYGFVKPPKTSSDPDDAPVRVVLYLGLAAWSRPLLRWVTDTRVSGVRLALASHSLPLCGVRGERSSHSGAGRGVPHGDSLDWRAQRSQIERLFPGLPLSPTLPHKGGGSTASLWPALLSHLTVRHDCVTRRNAPRIPFELLS